MSHLAEELENFICHCFIQWLVTEKIFNKWLDNALRDEGSFVFRPDHPRLQTAFNFYSSPEGPEFWGGKSDEWEIIYSKLEKEVKLRELVLRLALRDQL